MDLFSIFEVPRQIIVAMLSGIVSEEFLNPLFPIPYAKEISLGIVLLFTLISIFAGFKWVVRLVGIAFVIVGFLEGLGGGITAVAMILGIAILVKIIRKIVGHMKEGGMGGFKEEKGFGEEKMPEMKEEGEEFKMPGGEEEFKMSEEKSTMPSAPQQPTTPQPQQKVCPYCGTPLIYVPQYQRYYCPRCRRYI